MYIYMYILSRQWEANTIDAVTKYALREMRENLDEK